MNMSLDTHGFCCCLIIGRPWLSGGLSLQVHRPGGVVDKDTDTLEDPLCHQGICRPGGNDLANII